VNRHTERFEQRGGFVVDLRDTESNFVPACDPFAQLPP
jgi:hypothetical protein